MSQNTNGLICVPNTLAQAYDFYCQARQVKDDLETRYLYRHDVYRYFVASGYIEAESELQACTSCYTALRSLFIKPEWCDTYGMALDYITPLSDDKDLHYIRPLAHTLAEKIRKDVQKSRSTLDNKIDREYPKKLKSLNIFQIPLVQYALRNLHSKDPDTVVDALSVLDEEIVKVSRTMPSLTSIPVLRLTTPNNIIAIGKDQ